MRRIRIYHQGNINSGITVMLDQNASHHLLHVLRKKSGERFIIFNGGDGEFDATLISANKKTACVEIGAFYSVKTESALKIHLGIAHKTIPQKQIEEDFEMGLFTKKHKPEPIKEEPIVISQPIINQETKTSNEQLFDDIINNKDYEIKIHIVVKSLQEATEIMSIISNYNLRQIIETGIKKM